MGRIHKIEVVRGGDGETMDFIPLERSKGIAITLPMCDHFLLKWQAFQWSLPNIAKFLQASNNS